MKKQKRILIVGAGAWQVPMIKKAKEMGYWVGVVDYNDKAEGIAYADEYYNASTIDPVGVCKAASEFHADGITTVATDMPMRAIAFTCEQLGLTGIDSETALRSTDKEEMIKAFEKHGVPHPWYFAIEAKDAETLKHLVNYPCICKPTDNSASRGVIKINSEREFDDAVTYSAGNSRSNRIILEELLIGNEISVEAFAVDGVVTVIAITDKLTTDAPYYVEVGHSQPSKFKGETKQQIIEVTTGAMKAVGIKNGPAHVEMMVTENGPVMIELGARLGGGFITTDLVPGSTGVDMVAETIKLACNDNPNLTPVKNQGSAIRYMRSKPGFLVEVNGLCNAEKISGIQRVAMLKKMGDSISELHNGLDRVGYAIATGKTAEDAVLACEKAIDLVSIVVTD